MPEVIRSRDTRLQPRLVVKLPVRLKMPDTDQEIVCTTRDISNRGVFVYTDHPLPRDSRIQFIVNLKSSLVAEEGVQVLCSGTVVRVESSDERCIGMAATIDSCRLLFETTGNA